VNEPVWIDLRDALALHDRLLALDGGAEGLSEAGPLDSALARPGHVYAYSDEPGIVTLAASYTAGIVRNHSFVDGNKRTGFLAGVLFLEMNGYRFNASEEDAANAVMGLAAGTLDEAAFAEWLAENSVKR
jgi:death on curing protein